MQEMIAGLKNRRDALAARYEELKQDVVATLVEMEAKGCRVFAEPVLARVVSEISGRKRVTLTGLYRNMKGEMFFVNHRTEKCWPYAEVVMDDLLQLLDMISAGTVRFKKRTVSGELKFM